MTRERPILLLACGLLVGSCGRLAFERSDAPSPACELDPGGCDAGSSGADADVADADGATGDGAAADGGADGGAAMGDCSVHYNPNAVLFDGDWLTRDANLDGVADGTRGTLSLWVNMEGSPSGDVRQLFKASDHDRFGLRRAGSDQFIVNGDDDTAPPGNAIFQIASSQRKVSGTGWHHVLASWDVANDIAYVYVNDVLETTSSTDTTTLNADIAYTRGNDWSVGARNDGNSMLTGYLADLWFDADLFLDLTVEANRRRFISPAGAPVNPGADGTLPTGAPPDVFLTGDTAGWHLNRGTGGGFTVNGDGLATAPSRPGDEVLSPSAMGWSSGALNVLVHVTAAFEPSSCTPTIHNVAFDALAAPGSSLTISGYSVPPTMDGMMFVVIASEDDDNASEAIPSTVTFAGMPLSEAVTATGVESDKTASLYYLGRPAGSGDVTVVTRGPVETIQVGVYVASCLVDRAPVGTATQVKGSTRLVTGIGGVPPGLLVVDSIEHGGTEAGSLAVTRPGQTLLFTQNTRAPGVTSSQGASYRISSHERCGD